MIFRVHPTLFLPLVQTLVIAGVAGLVFWIFRRSDLGGNLGFTGGWLIFFNLSPFIIAAFVVGVIFLSWAATTYILTNLRVECQFGILRRTAKNIDNEMIQSVTTNQGIIGRIFNFGDVLVQSAATFYTITFKAIPDPQNYADQIEQQAGNL